MTWLWIGLGIIGGIVIGVALFHFLLLKAFWDNWK